jgi:hypothetical protein
MINWTNSQACSFAVAALGVRLEMTANTTTVTLVNGKQKIECHGVSIVRPAYWTGKIVRYILVGTGIGYLILWVIEYRVAKANPERPITHMRAIVSINRAANALQKATTEADEKKLRCEMYAKAFAGSLSISGPALLDPAPPSGVGQRFSHAGGEKKRPAEQSDADGPPSETVGSGGSHATTNLKQPDPEPDVIKDSDPPATTGSAGSDPQSDPNPNPDPQSNPKCGPEDVDPVTRISRADSEAAQQFVDSVRKAIADDSDAMGKNFTLFNSLSLDAAAESLATLARGGKFQETLLGGCFLLAPFLPGEIPLELFTKRHHDIFAKISPNLRAQILCCAIEAPEMDATSSVVKLFETDADYRGIIWLRELLKVLPIYLFPQLFPQSNPQKICGILFGSSPELLVKYRVWYHAEDYQDDLIDYMEKILIPLAREYMAQLEQDDMALKACYLERLGALLDAMSAKLTAEWSVGLCVRVLEVFHTANENLFLGICKATTLKNKDRASEILIQLPETRETQNSSSK